MEQDVWIQLFADVLNVSQVQRPEYQLNQSLMWKSMFESLHARSPIVHEEHPMNADAMQAC